MHEYWVLGDELMQLFIDGYEFGEVRSDEKERVVINDRDSQEAMMTKRGEGLEAAMGNGRRDRM